MLDFIVAWMIAMIVLKTYLTVKKIKIAINNDIISIVLSFSIVLFLTLIQAIFGFFIKLIF